ncbi:hypothetical protein SDRG_05756 [Saprolegnia diclina VS20]|uniref:Sec20 C-terminal domain-containing protein n=1 Tax=Saprolegnia diclina (strain VS20) TaxID=1156394 RepID=T0QSG5_SAPDV|nr:hypothetical protein SDRG_05756 [Saprolegnia diclina VS20]EQC36930.1 hypothetical protein SDRG_05756 [Saprolegnia diclina VS20]|eukprot:XP_008609711.1 hypothetical protein SDRG_05756 [Saprolegnia diclina VS20]
MAATSVYERVTQLLQDKEAQAALSIKEGNHLTEQLATAIQRLTEKIREDPDGRDKWTQHKARGEALAKQWAACMRKLRLVKEHEGLVAKAPGATKPQEKAPHVAVNQSLKRTQQILRQEMDRAGHVQARLVEGKSHLKQSNDSYTELDAELSRTRKLLTELQLQANKDRIWIGAGVALLSISVTIIVVERLPVLGFFLSYIY